MVSGCMGLSISSALVIMSGIAGAFPLLLTASGGTMTSLVPLMLMEWNGNPKNYLATFLVNVFGTKKKKMELKKMQEEYRKYSQSMEVFKLYVADIRMSLDEKGVLDVVNQNDKYNHHSIDADGAYHVSKVEPEKTHTMALNEARVDEMIKSLAKSPRMKEQLQIGLSK